MTAENGVLLRENAVHTHPPSQVEAQLKEWCKRFGHVYWLCRQSDTK